MRTSLLTGSKCSRPCDVRVVGGAKGLTEHLEKAGAFEDEGGFERLHLTPPK